VLTAQELKIAAFRLTAERRWHDVVDVQFDRWRFPLTSCASQGDLPEELQVLLILDWLAEVFGLLALNAVI
jgi:hypothetical protein